MLSKCCCCVPLRTGSLVLAIVGILSGFFYFARGFWPDIIQGIFYLIAYGFLLFGVLKYHEKAVLMCLVFTAVGIVEGIIMGIVAIASIDSLVPQLANNCAGFIDKSNPTQVNCDQLRTAAIGGAAGTLIIGSLLNVYFLICNYSFYKELKEGGAGSSA